MVNMNCQKLLNIYKISKRNVYDIAELFAISMHIKAILLREVTHFQILNTFLRKKEVVADVDRRFILNKAAGGGKLLVFML